MCIRDRCSSEACQAYEAYERYLSLGSTLPSASRTKVDLLEPGEEAPVEAEAEGGRILSWEA